MQPQPCKACKTNKTTPAPKPTSLKSTLQCVFSFIEFSFSTFFDALRAGVEIFQSLKKILSEKSLSTAVGDEGGFAIPVQDNNEALDVLMEAIEKAGHKDKVYSIYQSLSTD